MRAFILAVLSLACLAGMSLPRVADAQQPPPAPLPCGERSKIVAHIAKKYKEVPRSIAITGGNSVIEIYLSPTGTWTALVTDVTGKTCIVASGEGWEDIAIKPAGTSL